MNTATITLRAAATGTVVRFDADHPTRPNMVGTVTRPLDRGEMTNRAGFGSGVWVDFGAETAPMFADSRVTVVE